MNDDAVTPIEELALLIFAMNADAEWDWNSDSVSVSAKDFDELLALAEEHFPERFK